MMKRVMLILAIVFSAGVAVAANVPKYLNYQGVLMDDGGNPLPDGQANVVIRILDSGQKVIYEELQEVQVIGGIVSIMVGDGVNLENGAMTGGISADILKPDGSKYIELQADGYPPEGPMEFVSVPYATYADFAIGVAEGAVGSAQIKKGAIAINHFSDGLVEDLAEKLVDKGDQGPIVIREEFERYTSSISGSEGANNVGIKPDFNYSSSTNIQDVFKDLDLAVKKREEDVNMARNDYDTKITSEIKARNDADTLLQNNINSEGQARQTSDVTLQNNINGKVSKSGDTIIGDLIMQDCHTQEGCGKIIFKNTSDDETVKLSSTGFLRVSHPNGFSTDIRADSISMSSDGETKIRLNNDVGDIISDTNALAYGSVSTACTIVGYNARTVVEEDRCYVRFNDIKPPNGNYAVVLSSDYGGDFQPTWSEKTANGFEVESIGKGPTDFVVFWNQY